MEKESSTKEGLVGIFEVLGYHYIVENNQINYVADLFSKTILELPEEAFSRTLETLEVRVLEDIPEPVLQFKKN